MKSFFLVKIKFLFILGTVLTLLGSGCINIDYVGKTFPPTTKVKVYQMNAKIRRPYDVMGKAYATAKYQEYSREEMMAKLEKKAEDAGANAILITAYEIVPSGEVREDQLLDNSPNNAWALDDDSQSSWTRLDQNFDYGYGQIGKQISTDVRTYKRVLKVEFLRYK
jgi:hypothetical protein